MSGLSDLGAALRGCIEQIEQAQSSGNTTRDRGDEALRQLGGLGQGSGNVLIEQATENLAAASAAVEEVLGMYVLAAEQLRTYLGAQGL